MTLRALQREFQRALLAGDTRFLSRIAETPGADSARRLTVYAEAYRLRLREALEVDYPKLRTLLGPTQFAELADTYIGRHPSRHPSLRWLGRHMAALLAQTAPWSAQPVLSEMAAFEWAQGEVFDAPEAGVVAVAEIADIAPPDWPRLHFQAHPSLRRLDLSWNVVPIWQALDQNESPAPPSAATTPQAWLLWRRQLDIHWRSLGVEERWAVDAWRRGAAFGEICEGLCEWLPPEHVPVHAAGLLKSWVDAGLISVLVLD